MNETYYKKENLNKFGDISKLNKTLSDKFFDYYNSTVGDDTNLTKREKSLIGLAVAHALKCPYCIDAYTQSCMESGADAKQMSESVHVAASVAAGVVLVHSVQMQNQIEESSL